MADRGRVYHARHTHTSPTQPNPTQPSPLHPTQFPSRPTALPRTVQIAQYLPATLVNWRTSCRVRDTCTNFLISEVDFVLALESTRNRILKASSTGAKFSMCNTVSGRCGVDPIPQHRAARATRDSTRAAGPGGEHTIKVGAHRPGRPIKPVKERLNGKHAANVGTRDSRDGRLYAAEKNFAARGRQYTDSYTVQAGSHKVKGTYNKEGRRSGSGLSGPKTYMHEHPSSYESYQPEAWLNNEKENKLSQPTESTEWRELEPNARKLVDYRPYATTRGWRWNDVQGRYRRVDEGK